MDKNKVFVSAYNALKSGKDFGKDFAETGFSKEALSVVTKIAKACSNESEFVDFLNNPKNADLGSLAVKLSNHEMEAIRGGFTPLIGGCLLIGYLWGNRDRAGS